MSEEKHLRVKVSKKGGVSFYWLGRRFPVTLYKDEWVTLLEKKDEILEFIKVNESELKVKD